jgi:hypothetical protein
MTNSFLSSEPNWMGPGVICPKHGTHQHTISSTIKGHEGHWCMICALEALGDPLPTISQIEYLEQLDD